MRVRSNKERKLRKKNFWRGVMLFLIAFSLGIVAYRNDGFNKKLKYIYRFSFTNYFDGWGAEPQVLQLYLSEKQLKKINKKRKIANQRGMLTNDLKGSAKGSLFWNGDTIAVKMRLKGDYNDHRTADKFSLRIEIQGEERLLGMRTFSIQTPETRGMLNEWLFFRLLKEEGLIGLRYGFIEVQINDESRGIFAIEESFDKELIESNKRKFGPMIKFDESMLFEFADSSNRTSYSQSELFMKARVLPFKGKELMSKPELQGGFKHGEQLLNELRLGLIPLSRAIDIPKAAALFAVADLIGARDATRWKNVRFYYNPFINKLEVIGYDGNSGTAITQSYYSGWKDHRLDTYDAWEWKNLFFSDTSFTEAYFDALTKITAEGYLETFLDSAATDISNCLQILHSEYPAYNFSPDVFFKNRDILRAEVIARTQADTKRFDDYLMEATVLTETDSTYTGRWELEIINRSAKTLSGLAVWSTTLGVLDRSESLIYPGINRVVFEIRDTIDVYKKKVRRGKAVFDDLMLKAVPPGSKDTLEINMQYVGITGKLQTVPSLATLSQKMIEFNPANNTWVIQPGKWKIVEKMLLPTGHNLSILPGAQLDLLQGAYILVKGKLRAVASSQNPIIITSSDSSGALAVLQSKEVSELSHVSFYGLNTIQDKLRSYTGAVTFYQSPVVIRNVDFRNIHCEDALNTISCKATLDSVLFKSVKADAYDADFCTVSIQNTTFTDIGNDAIDFSGSTVEVNRLSISAVADKAISVGEGSRFSGILVVIENSEVAVTAKDLSSVTLDQVEITNCAVGIAAFVKKAEYGIASVTLSNAAISGFREKYLIEQGCKLQLNGESIEPNRENVLELMYGNEFGKKSIR